jgi:hypothetical protein
MLRSCVIVAACVLALSACGGEKEAAAPATAEKTPADRGELVKAAHGMCTDAQAAQDQATNRITNAKDIEANRAGWQARYDATADTFTRLRDVAERGADQPYDTFLAKWAELMGFVQSVVRDTGDQEEVEASFNAFNQAANELVDTALAADIVLCAAPFSLGGDPAND